MIFLSDAGTRIFVEGGKDVTIGVFVAVKNGKAELVIVGVNVIVLVDVTVGEFTMTTVGVFDGGTEVKVLVGKFVAVDVLMGNVVGVEVPVSV